MAGEGCMDRFMHLVFVIALIIGIIVFGGKCLSNVFDGGSSQNNETSSVELDNTGSGNSE